MRRPKQRVVRRHKAMDPEIQAPVDQPYERIAKRVLNATLEINEALQEAHKCIEMRVFMRASRDAGEPMQFQPLVYRLSHSTLQYKVSVSDPEEELRAIKDPSFLDASGQGLDAGGQVKWKKNK